MRSDCGGGPAECPFAQPRTVAGLGVLLELLVHGTPREEVLAAAGGHHVLNAYVDALDDDAAVDLQEHRAGEHTALSSWPPAWLRHAVARWRMQSAGAFCGACPGTSAKARLLRLLLIATQSATAYETHDDDLTACQPVYLEACEATVQELKISRSTCLLTSTPTDRFVTFQMIPVFP
jgi:hypothetical protein